MRIFILSFLFLIGFQTTYAQKKSNTDKAVTSPSPYDYKINEKYKGITVETYYVEMRDGVKLAIDVYKPKGIKAGEKFPALIHQTRYWRAPELRWPFKMFSDGLLGRMGTFIKDVVKNGYVIVNVDSRGSGASFGNRIHPWTADETKDGAEIIDWILTHDWSNGKVGSLGVSYGGTTAEFLMFNKHPNLKAVALMYSLYDVYDDISYPGGIFHNQFVLDWGKYNLMLDQDKIPRGGFIAKTLVKGVRRVKGADKKKIFHKALEDHKSNINVDEISEGVVFRDQVAKVPGQPNKTLIKEMDVFSPFTYLKAANESNVAVYCYSGWWDGGYQHSNIKRFLSMTNPENKLMIGPWEHGGKFNCSPSSPGLAGFDHLAEMLKFFDYHLKDKNNGLYDESRIHYFTMKEDQWKTAETWPPKSTATPIYFGTNNTLTFDQPIVEMAFDTHQFDTTAVTSTDSRWKSLIGKLETPHVYPDRKAQCEKLLHYTTAPFDKDMELTGHPIAHLFVRSDQPDGNFHVYLEEVESNGNVILITEGLLRASQRKLAEGFPLHKDAVPQRTYYMKDAEPLKKGEVAELIFDLLPTSYLFKKGSRLRISIAGADRNHFELMHKSRPVIEMLRSDRYPSHVVLPVK